MSRLLLIRHGQASFGKANYDQLSEKGYEQANILGEYFAQHRFHFDAIYLGKLKRHEQTLQGTIDAYQKRGYHLPEPIYNSDFNEHRLTAITRHFMPIIAQTNEKVRAYLDKSNPRATENQNEYFSIFRKIAFDWTDGKLDLKDTDLENWTDFQERVKAGFENITQNNQGGKTVAVYSSGGTIAAIVQLILGISSHKVIELNLVIRNSSITEVVFSKNRITLQSLNTLPHLPLEQKALHTFI